jgi:hypothetical protein
MGSKAKAPPPPDYGPIAAASERAAEMSFQLGQEQLAWAREQYANDSGIIQRIVDAAMQRAEINDADAARDRERYERIFQPLEDKLAQEAKDYASPERERLEMEKAQATVAQQFEAQRRAAMQNLESYGVDPTSMRAGALDLGARVSQAAAQAGAGNQARAQTEAIGRALRSEAINVGRGYPGQIAGTYATALQSNNQAGNTTLAGTASGASTMGTGTQWFSNANQALAGWGNTLNMGYNNALAAADFNSRQSSGLGALAGAALGAIGNAGGIAAFFEEGGAVPPGASSGTSSGIPMGGPGVTPGGNVPAEASPTRGAAIDDVTAKLTAGEFVIPKDAVSWYGERHFQQLIEKGRRERETAPAKPEYSVAPPAAPTFASRPGGAIPVG